MSRAIRAGCRALDFPIGSDPTRRTHPVEEISLSAPDPDARWLALLGAPGAGLFHSPPWISALALSYGFSPRACIASDASRRPVGGVAFCEIDDPLGHRLVSLPFSDACDPLLPDPECWEAVAAHLAAYRLPVDFRCLDGRLPAIRPEPVVTRRKLWHSVPLGDPADAIWSRVGKTTRRAIRKAERAGVTVRALEGEAGLAGFVRLHQRLRKRKYRLLAQPPAFFAALAERFQETDGWHPLGAFLGDRLLAATIYLRWGETLYYKFNASDPDGLASRPNHLLVWAGIQLARTLGCRHLDLGPSDADQPGLIRFKRAFGATQRDLHFLRWTPPGVVFEEDPEPRRALGELGRLLTAPEVPDELTGSAGAALYRFFA